MLGTCSSISRPFRFDVHISPTRMLLQYWITVIVRAKRDWCTNYCVFNRLAMVCIPVYICGWHTAMIYISKPRRTEYIGSGLSAPIKASTSRTGLID